MQISEEHINQAFDQIETIALIHEDEGQEAQFKAMTTYLEFLGLSEEAAQTLGNRVKEFVPKDRAEHGAWGWVYMGVVIGLTAAQKTESY